MLVKLGKQFTVYFKTLLVHRKKMLLCNGIQVPNKNEKRKIRSDSSEPNSSVSFSLQSTRTSLQSSRTMPFIAEVKKQRNHSIYT